MDLTIPYVLGVEESSRGNVLRQVAAGGGTVEGALAHFTREGVRGWLFRPGMGTDILIVGRSTRMDRIPRAYTRVLGAEIGNAEREHLDLSGAKWLRHERLGAAATREEVLDSWRDALRFIEEDPEHGVSGLRRPQIGALHAVHAHWSVSEETATVVMPTGTGKTDTMIAVAVSARCPRVLVVVPTDALRMQLANRFLTLGVLRGEAASTLNTAALWPAVRTLKHIPKTVADVHTLFHRAHVIVTTSSIAGQCRREVQEAIADQCSHLFIDEAHHSEAPTWVAFRACFGSRRVLQFTATPFREDGKALDGKLVYVYPLRKAQRDGYFRPIRFVKVIEFDRGRADEAIATAAVAQLRADADRGHILMARVESVKRARSVFRMYERYAEFDPVQLHTGMSAGERRVARGKLLSKSARIVVCVDMLGEGFDLPELKIAAFHDIRKTLSVTLQLAGRFTRARRDLGDATFIANTADVSVREELRRLYSRDPDWNVLLPQLGDALTLEQRSMQDFLQGFTEFVHEIPLRAVRPALSTVVYRTRCEDWRADDVRRSIPNVGSCEQVQVATNEARHTIAIVTARRLAVPWADVESLFGWEWELYVIFWWRERSLLFINGSTNAGEFSGLARAVAGEDVELIKGDQVFRAFEGVTRLRLNGVGLTAQLGRNVSFTNRMGADVAAALARPQRRQTRKSILSGSGFADGESVTIAASRKGRIWCHGRGRVDQLVAWCRKIGDKLLDPTIDPEVALTGTLETAIVEERPAGVPIGVDWPEEIYKGIETPWSVRIGEQLVHISEAQLEIVEPGPEGPVRFAVVCHEERAEFELEFFRRGEAADFRFVRRGDRQVAIRRADSTFEAAEFFSANPPRVWFADGASLDGNEYTPLKADLQPYDRGRIHAWDWTGVDIRREAQGDERDPRTIQAAVIARLRAEDYELVFDDDGAGEAADVVAVRLLGEAAEPRRIDVEFYHCKYSSEDVPGARVGDLYVVCGQAQSSVRWMDSGEKRTDLFTHLLRREKQRQQGGRPTRFERGDEEVVDTIREMSYGTPVTLKIGVVQPGMSRNRASEAQLRLLAVTENYLMETYQLPFVVIGSA